MARTLTRRVFLHEAASGLAALAASPSVARAHLHAGRAQSVLVVGAGMAGLGVALELISQGHDVTILEARSRPGGRVLTLREPFADGLYAEAGAMQVFDSHLRVQRLIREFGLAIDPIQPSRLASITHVLGRRIAVKPGEPPAWPFDLTARERDPQRGQLYAQYVVPHLQAILDAESQGSLLPAFAALESITFTEFLRGQGASQAAIAILNAGLPGGLGDGGDHHSALNLLREAAHRQLRRQSFTIRGGTDKLPLALADRLAARIHYRRAIVAIEHDEHRVSAVSVMPNGNREVFTADRLVCTLPFPVLRRLRVSPDFTPARRRAIESLRYTSVARVYVQTRTRFWQGEGLSGNASTDLPVMGVYERSINQAGTRGILESYQAGAQARRTTALPEATRVAEAIDGMAQVFPRLRAEAEVGASKCWDEDEWSRGAYAWFAPGEMASLLPHIAGAEGRIHFAGEHTSSSPGWMEGALESAERVVAEVAAAAIR